MNFLGMVNDNIGSKTDESLNPVALAIEIGEGTEELNAELIRSNVLMNAANALEKSIELDNQIVASGEASRGTVAYGAESLEMTANFLGVQSMDFESITAGLEDNDQEGATEKKKGFLEKIRNAAVRAWRAIVDFVNKLVKKVVAFFQSKAAEQTAEKIEKTGEEVTKAQGSGDKKPKCEDKKTADEEKEKIARKAPLFIYENGLKSVKDVDKLADAILDKRQLKSLESVKDVINNSTTNLLNSYATINSILDKDDASKVAKDVEAEIMKTANSLKLPKIEHPDYIEKIIKEHKDDIIENLKVIDIKDATKFIAFKDFLKEFKVNYEIIFDKAAVDANGNVTAKFVVIYKNEDTAKVISAVVDKINKADSDNDISETGKKNILKAIDAMYGAFTSSDIDLKINVKDITKKIEPFSGNELIELSKKVLSWKNTGKDYVGIIEKEAEKVKDSVDKAIKKIENVDGLKGYYNLVNKLLTTFSTNVSERTKSAIELVTTIGAYIANLSKACGAKIPKP